MSPGDVEMAPRVERVEQQLAERLPAQWTRLAGRPAHMHYFGTQINTFRANPELQPSAAFVRSALHALKQHAASGPERLTDTEMEQIVRQEWQSDMTRSVLEARLNRHQSADGPAVRRSASGVVFVCAQPAPGGGFVRDGMAPTARRKKAEPQLH